MTCLPRYPKPCRYPRPCPTTRSLVPLPETSLALYPKPCPKPCPATRSLARNLAPLPEALPRYPKPCPATRASAVAGAGAVAGAVALEPCPQIKSDYGTVCLQKNTKRVCVMQAPPKRYFPLVSLSRTQILNTLIQWSCGTEWGNPVSKSRS